MRRTLGLITALLLAAPAVIWTQGNPDRPFRFQGRTWVNQEAFVASGARCATRDLTPERRDQRRPGNRRAPEDRAAALPW